MNRQRRHGIIYSPIEFLEDLNGNVINIGDYVNHIINKEGTITKERIGPIDRLYINYNEENVNYKYLIYIGKKILELSDIEYIL